MPVLNFEPGDSWLREVRARSVSRKEFLRDAGQHGEWMELWKRQRAEELVVSLRLKDVMQGAWWRKGAYQDVATPSAAVGVAWAEVSAPLPSWRTATAGAFPTWILIALGAVVFILILSITSCFLRDPCYTG